jgi:FMNH2-dependent dimethyl sulfone monooxygenase
MRRHFRLALFASNCSGGLAITTVPERWSASWSENVALARLADDAGIDTMIPIARWIGYGGSSGFQDASLETITWAAGLLTLTRRLGVLATTHAAFIHPLVAAKQLATIDQMAHGRCGVNVVCGWNEPEYAMMGLRLPKDHVDRYAYGAEWLEVVRRAWSSEKPFDWDGAAFQLRGASCSPRPAGGTMTVANAGFSDEGRAFAAAHADVLLTSLLDRESARSVVADVTRRALGRPPAVIGVTHVVCRPSQREAEEYLRYYADERADYAAVDRLIELQAAHAKSFPPEALRSFRKRFAAGHGTYPLIGDPDRIADELAALAGAGLDGVTIAFVNYLDELPYFCEEVLPRLVAQGLRSAVG